MPLTLVAKSFEDLLDVVLEDPSSKYSSLSPLFDYFESYWLTELDLKRWNVYGLQIRTNNNAEGSWDRLPSAICFIEYLSRLS